MKNSPTAASAPIDDLLRAIADNLVLRTRQAGMDRLDLARLADLNRNTVGAALAGGDIKLSTLIRLTRALGYAEWLQPLLAEPEPSPLEQLQASLKGKRRRRSGTADAAARKPVSQPVGRGGEGSRSGER